MLREFDPGALLGAYYTLPDGRRVRLRMAAGSDAPALRRLLSEQGEGTTSLAVARLVRFNPRRSVVLCATALIDGRERLLGVGSIALEAGETVPDVVVDAEAGEDVRDLLAGALIGRARALGRSAA